MSTEQVVADASEYTILEKNWNKMINIGGIYLLLQKEIQDHTLFLCKTLGFEYVRIWDLYETRMHINAGKQRAEVQFQSSGYLSGLFDPESYQTVSGTWI